MFSAEGLDHGRQQVATGGRVGGLVVGQARVPQAKALVMLGGHDEVFHPRARRRLSPELGVVQVGVEPLEVLLIVDLGGDFLVVPNPLVAGGLGVQAPVNEQPETVVHVPTRVAGGTADGLGHEVLLLLSQH